MDNSEFDHPVGTIREVFSHYEVSNSRYAKFLGGGLDPYPVTKKVVWDGESWKDLLPAALAENQFRTQEEAEIASRRVKVARDAEFLADAQSDRAPKHNPPKKHGFMAKLGF